MNNVVRPTKRYLAPQWLRAPDLADVEFLFCDHDRNLWHVYHERYVLCACEQTSNALRYRGKVEQLFDGAMLLMEPGEAHRNLRVPRLSHFRVAFIEPELFRRAAEDHGLRATPHFARAVVDHPQLTRAVYELCASVEAEDTVLEQQSRLAKCLWLALPHTETGPSIVESHYPDELLTAKAYITERHNQAITLDDVSARCGMSPYHLIRSFTRNFGLPPHAYQIHIRVERARSLLRAGRSLAEAASITGFADQSHFARHFRRVMNMTPGAYVSATRGA